MNIGVSAWRLSGQRLGIGRYIEYLLKHWNPMLRVGDRVSLYVHEAFNPRSLDLSEPLGEVAHGYALTIEKPDLDALTGAMHRVLTDSGMRTTLRQKSLERGLELRWDRTARRTLEVLREVAAS